MKKTTKKAAPKKTKKPVAKARKKTAKKSMNKTVVASPKMFRVEMEHPNYSSSGTTFSFIPCTGRVCVEESVAKTAMAELKEMGVGGRLILLEDKGKETVTETWGSVERATTAEATEKEALPAKA